MVKIVAFNLIEFEILLEPEEQLLTVFPFHTTPGCLGYFFFRITVVVYSKKFLVGLTDRRVIVFEVPQSLPIDLSKHMSLQYKNVVINENFLFLNPPSEKKRQLSFDWGINKEKRAYFRSILEEQSEKEKMIG